MDGTSLKLIYSEALKTDSVPAVSDYSVDIAGTAAAPSTVGISGAKVTLTLTTGAASGNTVTVSYTKPSTNPLQDLGDNDAAALSTHAVANYTDTTNHLPVFATAAVTRSVAETNTSGTAVGAAVTATVGDSSDTLTYALVGPDASSFTIETMSGQIQTNAALDFETTPTSYSVVVTVTDSKKPDGTLDSVVDDAIAVTINVTNVNEAPEIGGDNVVMVPENTTAVGTYTVDDVDVGDLHTWTVESGGDGALFAITSGGVLSFNTAPNYEAPGFNVAKTVRINVTDNGSPVKSHTLEIRVVITDVNEPPVITTTETSHTAFSVAENTGTSEVLKTYMADDPDAGDSLTWSLSGHSTDTSVFTIVGGVLKFSAVRDYENATDNNRDNVYEVTVNVRDSGGSIDASLPVAVTVTNVEEPGTATFTGDLSGGSTLTASVTDPDGDISSQTYQWQRSNTSGGSFNNITASGTSETYMLVAADVGKWLKVRVSYTDGEGANKVAPSGERGPVGASNSAPTFINGMTAMRTLPENSSAGTNAGSAVAATDGDNDTLTYALKSGNDSGDFTIVSTSGQIQAKSGEIYNFEGSKNSYTVIVTVHDGKDAAGGASSTVDAEITVTINLTNVNEDPVLTSPPTTLSKPENSTDVHAYAATDPDAGTVFSWSLSGADAGDFSISTSGVLTFRVPPDFENPTDSMDHGGFNVYVVTVKATDNGTPPLKDQHTLRVTVTDVNETPEITSGPATISKDENTPTTEIIATYVATDPEQDATTGGMTGEMSWDLLGNDAGDFTITSTVNGTANLYFKNVPNYEVPADAGTDNGYDVTVRVSDNGSGSTKLRDTQDVVVTVNDVNETPVISGGATPSFAEIEFDATSPVLTVGTYTYMDEDRPPDTITWDLSGTDETHFEIGSTSGALSFKERPNFEVPVDMPDTNMMGASNNLYVVVVEANDGEGGGGTFNVTVTVTNVDETPEVTSGNPTHTFAEIEYDYEYADMDLQVDIFTARDEEDGAGGIIWAVSGTDGGDFTISSGTTTGEGVLYFRPDATRNIPDYERPNDMGGDNVYNIIVKATDTTSHTRDYDVTVTVTDVNERPDISENFDGLQEYMEIEYDATAPHSLVHTFTATDYDDGDTFTWMVTGTDAAYLDIGASDGVLTFNQSACTNVGPLPDFEEPCDDDTDGNNTYTITVVATDNHAKQTDYAVVVTVTDVNEVPEFTEPITLAVTVDEHDANVEGYAMPTIATYVARDEEDGGVTWSLTGDDRLDFAIDSNGVVTFAAAPNYEEPEDSGGDNVYEFSVVATDVESGTSRRTVSVDVTVTVADKEELGTLAVEVNGDAANNNPAVGDRVEFTLTDPDVTDSGDGIDVTPPSPGQPPPIDWTLQLRSPGGAWQTKQTNNPLGTDFHYVVDEDDEGKELRATVTYIDERGPGKTAESDPTAAVTEDPIANVKPRFDEGGTQNVVEGDTGRTVGIPITASDRDPDSLTFSIKDGAHSDKFELVVVNNTTVRLRTTQALDFETTSGPLFLQVTVDDGKDADGNPSAIDADADATTTVTVTILDVEEDGVLTLSDDEPGVGETLTTTLSDGDGMIGGQMWQWARSENGRDGWTNTGGTTSSYTTTLADADFFLRAKVTYTDRRGDGKTAEAKTTERVFGENQRPTFPSTESGARTVEENTRAGVSVGDPVAAEDMDDDRLTYSLSGTDAATFSIVTTTGQLRTKEPLDFETKPSYSVTVEVHDGLDGLGQPSMSIDDMQDVTITIENVEEQGTVTLSSATGTIRARVPVMATLADDDIPSGTVMWQWARSPNGRTDWVTIATATSATFTPTDDDEGNYIRARASYTDGEDSGKMAEKVSPRVGDAPPVNSAPVFPTTETGQREVAENATGSTNIGDPVAATDLNAGDSAVNDPLEYSLSGTDAASFTIDSGTGQLRLAQGVTLDYEGKRSYRVTVEVTDGANDLGDNDPAGNPVIDARKNVTITLTDVNEAPVVTGETAPSFDENGSNAVASYTGTDPERDTLTWTVSGNVFWISQRGQLYFLTPPSFEQRTSYTVSVMAADDGGLTGSLSVTVTMTDVEEDGVVTLSPLRGWEGTRFTASLADGDGSVSGRTWQWQRSSNRSSWQDIPGATSSSSSSAYTAQAEDVDMYLRATISYTDRLGSGKMASAVLAGQIGDASPPQNNEPEFADTTDTRSVGQGTAAGRSIGAPVRATDDDPGDILTYSITGSDARLFSIDPGTGQLRTKDVLDYEPQGTNEKTVTVQVRDGFSSNYTHLPNEVDDTIRVTITVTQVAQRVITGVGGGGGGGGGGAPQNRSAEFTEGSTTERSIAENTPAGADIGDPVAATDREDDTLTYSLHGVDAESFDIDPATGQLFTKAPLDYEAKAGYSVIVSVSDGKSSSGRDSDTRDDSITVTINVVNVDEPGEVALSSHQPQVDVALTATLADLDGGLVGVVWLWERSADQADWTEIDGARARIYTPVMGDLGDYLRATASYTDGHGRGKSAEAATGDPVLVNTIPRFPIGGITIVVEEGSGDAESGGVGEPVAAADPDGDTLTYSLSGADAGSFEIDASTGQLWSNAPLDYETQAVYTVVVSVRDSRDSNGDPDTAVDAEVTVTIAVVNVGEPGVLTLLSSQPRVGVPLAARLTDPDGIVGEVVWKWERSRDGNPWSNSWRAISGAESSAYASVGADVGYYLRVTASYADGHGPDKSRQAISEGRVMEFTGPVFAGAPNGVFERSVAENTGEGEVVSDPVAATSPDGGALTYALGGADAALFVIDAGTGQIRVGAGTELDHEANGNVYEVTVTATDSSGASATVAVTITVTNVELAGIANDYDADKNEVIDRAEALAAVADYFTGAITQDEAVAVVQLYFAG